MEPVFRFLYYFGIPAFSGLLGIGFAMAVARRTERKQALGILSVGCLLLLCCAAGKYFHLEYLTGRTPDPYETLFQPGCLFVTVFCALVYFAIAPRPVSKATG